MKWDKAYSYVRIQNHDQIRKKGITSIIKKCYNKTGNEVRTGSDVP